MFNDEKPASGCTVEVFVSIPLDLAEDLRDYMDEIIGERHWWSMEKRCNYQRDYGVMIATRDRVSKIIDDANATGEGRGIPRTLDPSVGTSGGDA